MTFTAPFTRPFSARPFTRPFDLHAVPEFERQKTFTNTFTTFTQHPLHVFPPLYIEGETGGGSKNREEITMIYRSATKGDDTRYTIVTSYFRGRLKSVIFAEIDPLDTAVGYSERIELRAKDIPQLIAQLAAIYADRRHKFDAPPF